MNNLCIYQISEVLVGILSNYRKTSSYGGLKVDMIPLHQTKKWNLELIHMGHTMARFLYFLSLDDHLPVVNIW